MSTRYCDVYGCHNVSATNTNLSLFKAPANIEQRAVWLRLIDREDVGVQDVKVCEIHFRPEDILQHSKRKLLRKYVVPSLFLPKPGSDPYSINKKCDKVTQTNLSENPLFAIQLHDITYIMPVENIGISLLQPKVCRICLAMDCKMYEYQDYWLKEFYLNIMECKVSLPDDLPRYFCYECAALLHKYHQFKRKCFNGFNTLRYLISSEGLSHETVSKTDRKKIKLKTYNTLTANMRVKTYFHCHNDTTHCDTSDDGDIDGSVTVDDEFDKFDKEIGIKLEADINESKIKTDVIEIIEEKLHQFDSSLNEDLRERKEFFKDNTTERDMMSIGDDLSDENDVKDHLNDKSNASRMIENIFYLNDDLESNINETETIQPENLFLEDDSKLIPNINDTKPVEELVENVILHRNYVKTHVQIHSNFTETSDIEIDNLQENNKKAKLKLSKTKDTVATLSKLLNKKVKKKGRKVNEELKMRRNKVFAEALKTSHPKYAKKKATNIDKSMWKTYTLSEEQAWSSFRALAQNPKYISAKHKCTKCYTYFTTADKLERHEVFHGESRGNAECAFCGTRFKRNCRARNHALKHYKRFECLKCPFKTSGISAAVFHEAIHSNVEKLCPHCGESYKHTTTYYTHLRTHRSQHVCKLCGVSFVSEQGLLLHTRKIHCTQNMVNLESDDDHDTSVNTFCEKCDIRFETRAAYIEHVFQSANHDDEGDLMSARQRKKCRDVTKRQRILKLAGIEE